MTGADLGRGSGRGTKPITPALAGNGRTDK